MVRYLLFVLLISSLTSCHLEVLDPIRNGLVADFSVGYENQGPYAPLDVSFFNVSTEAASFRWDFGDGTLVSTEFSPVHNYKKPRDYIVKLVATNDVGEEDEFTLPISIKARGFFKVDDPTGFSIQTGNAGMLNDSTYFFLVNGSNHLYDLDGNFLRDDIPRTHDTLSENAYYSDPVLWFGNNEPTFIGTWRNPDDLAISTFQAGDLIETLILPNVGQPLVHYKDPSTGVLWITAGSLTASTQTTLLKIENRETEVTSVEFETPYRILSMLPLSNGNIALTCSTEPEVGTQIATITLITITSAGTIERSFPIVENGIGGNAKLIREENDGLVVAYSDGLLSILRYNLDGTLEETREITNDFHIVKLLSTIAGEVFIIGSDLGVDTETFSFLKLNGQYDQVWQTSLELLQEFLNFTSVTETPDCGFLLAGGRSGGETLAYRFLIKLRPDGTFE